MIDRLEILKDEVPPHDSRRRIGHGNYGGDGQQFPEPATPTIVSNVSSCYYHFMPEYFAACEKCQESLGNITQLIGELRKLRSKAATSTSTKQDAENSKQLEHLLVAGQVRIEECKVGIFNLKKMTEIDVKNHHIPTNQLRIRENMRVSLAQRLFECVKDYQDNQAAFKATMQAKHARQLAVVFPDATEAEVHEMAKGGVDQQGVVMAKMQGTHVSVQDALGTIRAKHNDVLNLEESINEIRDMFLEIAALVETQGMLVDQVEMFVDDTITTTEKAQHEYEIKKKQNRKILNFKIK